MLKPLKTTYRAREITLECTHKRSFPPPQMYGSTPDDIDTLWKQGTIDQNQYQHLKVWQENCGLMVMGPKCLDCPLALKQNPRPGRPHVIETENWLDRKRKMYWDDMKAGKLGNPDGASEEMVPLADRETPIEPTPVGTASTRPAPDDLEEHIEVKPDLIAEGVPDPELPVEGPFAGQHDESYPVESTGDGETEEPASIADILAEEGDEPVGDDDLDDDIISALADD